MFCRVLNELRSKFRKKGTQKLHISLEMQRVKKNEINVTCRWRWQRIIGGKSKNNRKNVCKRCNPFYATGLFLYRKFLCKCIRVFFKLVFHYLNFPVVWPDKVPTLTDKIWSKMIAEYLNTLHAARNEFSIHGLSAILWEALNRKTINVNLVEFENRDSLFYKKIWKGRATAVVIIVICETLRHIKQNNSMSLAACR